MAGQREPQPALDRNSRRLGRTDWFLRLRCVPDSARPIARALARRDDISWVMLTSAGAEITCQATISSRGQRDALLPGTLPRSRQIVQVDALSVLRPSSPAAPPAGTAAPP